MSQPYKPNHYYCVPYWLYIITGKGAYGTVYKAVEIETGEIVAIKVILLVDQPPEDFQLIEKEIEFLASCNHPNVVRYLVSDGRQ